MSSIQNLKKIQLCYNSKVSKVKYSKGSEHNFKTKISNSYGIITGIRNNLTVVDIDSYKLPKGELSIVEKLYPNFKKLSFCVQSPHGGHHLYFKYDKELKQTQDNETNIINYYIDIRNDGGYIVGPGSTLDGIPYKIINDVEIQTIPDDLKKLLLEKLYNPTKKKQQQRKKIINKINPNNIFKNNSYNYHIDDKILYKIIKKIPQEYFTDVQKWIKFTTFMKILNKKKIWDDVSSKYANYNQKNNFTIWNSCNINLNMVEHIINISKCQKYLPYIKYKSGIENDKKPDFIINQQKLGSDFLDKYFKVINQNGLNLDCLIIKSDTGTGKTYSTKQYLKNKKFISITSRVSLAREQYFLFNEGLNLECKYYKDSYIFENKENLVSTIDSIFKIDFDTSEHIIYLDELSSIIEYLFDSTTMNNKRLVVFRKFLDILSNSKQIIATDADINNLCFMVLDFLKINYRYIVNKFKHNKNIESQEILLEKKFIEKLKKQKKFIVCSDSKTSCEILYKKLNDDSIKLYVGGEIEEDIELDKHDKIIYSPKIIYGIDSSIKRPIFCYYKQNTISSKNMLQQVCRCRNIKKLYYFFQNKKVTTPLYNSFDECIIDIVQKSKMSGTYYEAIIGEKINNFYLKCFSLLQFIKDCDRVNKFKNFKLLLVKRGFIDKVKSGETIKENNKEIKQRILNDKLQNFEKDYNEKYSKKNKYLQIPTDKLNDYKEYFIDDFKLLEHFNISNLLFKQNEKLYNEINERNDFNIKKIDSNKNKILNLKKILENHNINIKNVDCSEVEEVQVDPLLIKNVYGYKNKIENKKDLQKFLNNQIKKIFNVELFKNKRVNFIMKDKKRARINIYKMDETLFQHHKTLYDFRNVEEYNINFI